MIYLNLQWDIVKFYFYIDKGVAFAQKRDLKQVI